jgi:hypothetical protein
MAPATAAATLWAGVGLLVPAAAGFALREGLGAGAGAAILSGAFLAALAAGWKPALGLAGRPWPLLALPASTLLGAAALLPLLGLRLAALAGAALAAAGAFACARSQEPGAPPSAPPVWLLALAGAAAAAWARCLGLLWGSPFYALCALAAAPAAGLALGLWVRGRWLAGPEPGFPRRALVLASALAGLGGLCWLRFIGFNAGDPEYLLSALRGPRDLFFIVGQSSSALALWCAVLALAWEPGDPSPAGPARVLGRAALTAAGPLAAWAVMPRLGPAETAAAAHIVLAAASLAAGGQRCLLRRPVLSKVALAAAALGLFMGWQSRGLLADIWLYRLDAAWAGGRYLVLRDDGREVLGAYRFSSGVTALLRDGAAWVQSPLEAKRQAHLPLLMQGAPSRVLLLGVRSPVTVESVMAHGVDATAVDPHPGAGLVLAAQAAGPWPPASPADNGARLSSVRADPRRYLRAAGPPFDAILADLPFPALSVEQARLVTREAFLEMRARLAPAGLAALRLPAPYPPRRLARLLRTARSVFDHVGGYELPGGYLLICSGRPLAPRPAELLARRSVFAHADDLDLEDELPGLSWDDWSALPPAAAAPAPDTDDRPSGFYPLPDLARGLVLVHTAAEAVRK